jgi:ABC-type transport system involved in multi-copper enzyme maturation permease subunit
LVEGGGRLLVGPVFTREAVTAPRRITLFLSRAGYVAVLLALMFTAWLLLPGTQVVRNVGDLARFGAILFQVLAPLQLALALFFSALLAASGVAQEKDRRTLVLLLLTNLSNSELVLGKLLASMLFVLVLLGAALPLFMLLVLLGGTGFEQVGRVFAVTLAASLAAGSLGSTLALWREKTFQTLALTLLILVFWLAVGEATASGVFGSTWQGGATSDWAATFSPWHALLAAARPELPDGSGLLSFLHLGDTFFLTNPAVLFLGVSLAFAFILNAIAIFCVRIWNPSREARLQSPEAAEAGSIWGAAYDITVGAGQPATADRPRSVHAAPGKTRAVWSNPIIWREMRTWAYGRKTLIIRLAYLLLFACATAALYGMINSPAGVDRNGALLVLVPLFLVSLTLVNAQAVTSLTTERDLGAIDLLLVTDLTAKEFVFGKLGGALYNAKEMVVLPLLLCGYLGWIGIITTEDMLYLMGGLSVLYAFALMLGVHSGMSYFNSRSAIGVSLGTIFFLFVGIATCIRLLIAFGGSFNFQLPPFIAFMLGGGLGMFVALGARNASTAIGVASFFCPIATFYAITSIWLGQTLGPFMVIAAMYGFTTAAMLVPAVYEFDVATGRTTASD